MSAVGEIGGENAKDRPKLDFKRIISIFECVLGRLCERGDKGARERPSRSRVTRFHAQTAPGITIGGYLRRIWVYSSCSRECFILALIYIDRVVRCNPSFVVDSRNIHRLLITSVMLSSKYMDDTNVTNEYFSQIGGVTLREINYLEVEFLFLLNFSLHFSRDTFQRYESELNHHSEHSLCCDKKSKQSRRHL